MLTILEELAFSLRTFRLKINFSVCIFILLLCYFVTVNLFGVFATSFVIFVSLLASKEEEDIDEEESSSF